MDPVSSIQAAHASQAAAWSSASTMLVGTGIVVVGSVMMSVGFMADNVLRRRRSPTLQDAPCFAYVYRGSRNWLKLT